MRPSATKEWQTFCFTFCVKFGSFASHVFEPVPPEGSVDVRYAFELAHDFRTRGITLRSMYGPLPT